MTMCHDSQLCNFFKYTSKHHRNYRRSYVCTFDNETLKKLQKLQHTYNSITLESTQCALRIINYQIE